MGWLLKKICEHKHSDLAIEIINYNTCYKFSPDKPVDNKDGE